MKAVSAAARFELFFPLLSLQQLVADIETCFVGGEVGGRVLQGGDGVLRQPRLREDGVVGGEDGGEECRQDEEEVEKRGSSIRSIDLGNDKIITCNSG